MKKELFIWSVATLGFGFALTSCNKDDNNNGELTYQVVTSGSTAVVASAPSNSGLQVNIGTASSITWQQGTLNVSEIDLEFESETRDDDDEFEFEFKQFSSIDLFDANQVLGSVDIPNGVYEEVEIEVELRRSTSNPALRILGNYVNDLGAQTPIEFVFNEDVEIEIETEDITINEETNLLGIINLQLNRLLTNVSKDDLLNATLTDGRIVISSSSNSNLYNKLKANLFLFGECEFDD